MRFGRSILRTGRVVLSATLAASALACVNTVEPVNVHLITKACNTDPSLDPLSGVNMLRFTVYGPGIQPFQAQTRQSLSAGSIDLPSIPAGKERNIVVEALAGANADVVVARGETGPLDLSESTEPLAAGVFLRRVEAFTPMAPQDAPTTCGQLTSARAAHTVTTLASGKVLIAGGYFDDNAGRDYLATTEIYDPATGVVTPGPNMNLPRAYHTATHIPGTHLTVIAGGENDLPGKTGGALQGADIYDEDANQFTFVRMKYARTRHAAAAPVDGSAVLLVGGYNSAGVPIPNVEWFNPQTRAFEDGGTSNALTHGRAELTAVGLDQGRVLVVGGWDGSSLSAATDLFVERPNAATFDRVSAWNVTLKGQSGQPQGLSYPLGAQVDATHVVITGGYNDHPAQQDAPLLPYASRSTFIVDFTNQSSPTVTAGPALVEKRGQGGIVTLLDGTVMVVGGGSQDSTPKASSSAELFYATTQPGSGPVGLRKIAGSMKDGRYLAAFSVLNDGTVFVSGGITYNGTQASFLRSVDLFQPPYQISPDSPYR